MLNLTRLRLLNELATLRTITAVARARGTTRPAVSQQLALLEKEVGTTLFERTSSGIRMTTEGERLSSRIGALFDMVEDIEAELASSSDVVVGQVRLSAFGSFSTGIVPTVLSILRQLHPRLTLMFTEYASQEGIRAVVARETDIAVIDEWADIQRPARSLEISTLGTDNFVAVVSREHPLANRKAIRLADLADDMWAINQEAASYRSILLNACLTAGFTPKEVCNCRNVSAIIEFIKKIGLVSVLPCLSLQPFLDDDQIKLITLTPSLTREIRVVTLPGALKRQSLNAIVQVLGDVTKGRG